MNIEITENAKDYLEKYNAEVVGKTGLLEL